MRHALDCLARRSINERGVEHYVAAHEPAPHHRRSIEPRLVGLLGPDVCPMCSGNCTTTWSPFMIVRNTGSAECSTVMGRPAWLLSENPHATRIGAPRRTGGEQRLSGSVQWASVGVVPIDHPPPGGARRFSSVEAPRAPHPRGLGFGTVVEMTFERAVRPDQSCPALTASRHRHAGLPSQRTLTLAILQGLLIVIVCLIAGFRPAHLSALPLALLFMILIAVVFAGLGTVIGSSLQNTQGFQLIMNFLVMPIFFLWEHSTRYRTCRLRSPR